MNKTEIFGALIFAIVGGIFAVVGVFLHINNAKFMETAESTNATITRIHSYYDSTDDSTEHDVYVKFDVDGDTYSGKLGTYHTGMYEGGTTTVYYNPNNPGDFRGSGTGFMGIIFAGMGGLFFIIGMVMIISKVKASSSAKSLKATGTLLHAKINDITLNTSYAVNGRNPYRVSASCEDPSTGNVLEFTSGNIWFNIKAVVESKSITTVDVYVDPTNPKKYFVDVESLKSFIVN